MILTQSAQWRKTSLKAEVDVKMAALKIVVTREGLFLSGLMVDFPVLRSQWKSHNEDKRDSSVI